MRSKNKFVDIEVGPQSEDNYRKLLPASCRWCKSDALIVKR